MRGDAHGRRLAAARARLDWLTDALQRHIALEELELMPVYRTLEPEAPNARPEVFLRDHALIQRLLAEADVALAEDRPVPLADALAQLEGVLEHHDIREERYFKARLDDAMPAADRARVLEAHARPGPLPEVDGQPFPAPADVDGGPDGPLRWAVAVGDRDTALRLARAIPAASGKLARHRNALIRALERAELPEAHDRLRLLRATRLGLAAEGS